MIIQDHEDTLFLFALAAMLAIFFALSTQPINDGTDSGVGCVDDCLELRQTACTFETCQD